MIEDRTDSSNKDIKLCRRVRGLKGVYARIVKYTWNGYLTIYQPDHHFADYVGRIRLHRWVYEHFHKVCLLPWTEIHHINGIKTDNHKVNLMAVSRSEHRRIHGIGNKHRQKNMSGRICLLCKTDKTSMNKKGCLLWHMFNDGFVCSNCYMRLWRKKRKNAPPLTDKYYSERGKIDKYLTNTDKTIPVS